MHTEPWTLLTSHCTMHKAHSKLPTRLWSPETACPQGEGFPSIPAHAAAAVEGHSALRKDVLDVRLFGRSQAAAPLSAARSQTNGQEIVVNLGLFGILEVDMWEAAGFVRPDLSLGVNCEEGHRWRMVGGVREVSSGNWMTDSRQ